MFFFPQKKSAWRKKLLPRLYFDDDDSRKVYGLEGMTIFHHFFYLAPLVFCFFSNGMLCRL